MKRVSVSPTYGNGPTQGPRKTLTKRNPSLNPYLGRPE